MNAESRSVRAIPRSGFSSANAKRLRFFARGRQGTRTKHEWNVKGRSRACPRSARAGTKPMKDCGAFRIRRRNAERDDLPRAVGTNGMEAAEKTENHERSAASDNWYYAAEVCPKRFCLIANYRMTQHKTTRRLMRNFREQVRSARNELPATKPDGSTLHSRTRRVHAR